LKNLEEGSFTGDVEETVKDCSINAASLSLSLSLSVYGSSVRGTWREVSSTGNSES